MRAAEEQRILVRNYSVAREAYGTRINRRSVASPTSEDRYFALLDTENRDRETLVNLLEEASDRAARAAQEQEVVVRHSTAEREDYATRINRRSVGDA
eukprot:CAMPEP_0194032270 /NCGR_PEP_ID=MMETSP0009_2-20130614/5253_1 /TAXON_ID=210454 /ORGANISM="Grammatophora oceanica, Strain CCMP 410" /LENGTH=97 /DNA_ID=CAMNT_0038672659 /DNA_START=249 /DNA_END=542 /DNA_ORIENTATION=-